MFTKCSMLTNCTILPKCTMLNVHTMHIVNKVHIVKCSTMHNVQYSHNQQCSLFTQCKMFNVHSSQLNESIFHVMCKEKLSRFNELMEYKFRLSFQFMVKYNCLLLSNIVNQESIEQSSSTINNTYKIQNCLFLRYIELSYIELSYIELGPYSDPHSQISLN